MSEDKKENMPESESKSAGGAKKKTKPKRSLFHRMVNWFLYFLLGIFVLFLIILGITQTATFRDYLRDTVIEQANANLNGTVYIEKIEGTILTSLLLRNTVVNIEEDTLLKAGVIELKTSPLQLLLKKIKVRYFEIKDAEISLAEDSSGVLNIVKLLPESEPDTTAAGKFPFKIEVSDFRLTNVNFSMQRYEFVNSTASYDSLFMSDFRAVDVNLRLSAFANIDENDFEISIEHFSVKPNINNVEVKNLTGDFFVNTKELIADEFIIETTNSNVELSAKMTGFNLFDSTAQIGNALVEAELDAGEFSFADLVPFVQSMNIMRGKIAAGISVNGQLDDLTLNDLNVNFLNTNLSAHGSIKNLSAPEKMYISTEFYDTYVNANDINELMPSLKIPGADQLGVLRFDTLTYAGSPQKFFTNVHLNSKSGMISLKGNLDFESPLMTYDVKLVSRNLNIVPVAGTQSNLNLNADVKGSGTSPEELNAVINLTGNGSEISGINLDTLIFSAEADNGLINYDLLAASDSLGVDLLGDISFADSDNPVYKLEGNVRNLNTAKFMGDSSAVTNLNFTLSAEGENFDPELMNLYLSLLIYESTINGHSIDSTRAIVDLRKQNGTERVINLISDLADITVIGHYSVPQTIELMSSEVSMISSAVKQKLKQIAPTIIPDSLIAEPLVKQPVRNYVQPRIGDYQTNMTYLIDLKNVGLLSLFLGDARIEVEGEMSGEIINQNDSLQLSFNAAIEHVKYWGTDDIFFISNFNLDLAASNNVYASSFEELYARLVMTTNRVFAGTDLHDINLNLELENENANLNFSALLEDYAGATIIGNVDLKNDEVALLLDTLKLNYNNFTLQNDSTINVAYSRAGIDIRSFVLNRNGGNISLSGSLAEKGDQQLNISINDINGADIAANLLQINLQNPFNAIINMDSEITGSLEAPVIDLDLNVDSVFYQNRTFGSLITRMDYKNRNLNIDMRFIDSAITAGKPALHLKGNVPVNLAFTGVKERFSERGKIDLSLNAEDFNLQAFGDILPVVNNLRGNLSANLRLTGTPENLIPEGYLRLQDVAFIVELNNLEYNAALSTSITKDYVSIDTLMIKNVDGTEDGGTMYGSGKAQLDNMNITGSQFTIHGELKVLDEQSKGASPSAYGTLVIGTRGNVEFIADENQTKLTAPVVIKNAELTIPPTQAAYQNTSTNFIYKYVEDTMFVGGEGPSFESLIQTSKERSALQQSRTAKESTFDFSIDLEIEDEATIIYVLSKELNQNLTAVLSGNIIYESIGGRTNTQGELELREGSTLEFIKTLEADGTVRFENELTNPNLNITATYLDYYYEGGNGSGGTGSPEEIPVAVKIKVTGLLSELDKNFIREENNIAVYYGQEDIDNNTPDPRFDASDAVYFIITGDFIESASAPPQTNQAYKQAAAIAGSVLGGFLNRQTGGYVKTVELRQVGERTYFNLTGRVNKFRYTIGGDQHVFQDLSQASIKIEYPLIENLLLRLERKQAINETSITNDMINELGLRYRFEF